MKQKLLGAIVVLLMGFGFISQPQIASAGSLQSFVTDEYYLGAGGEPPTLSEFAQHPRSYLRSEAAYQALKQEFATKSGRSAMSDAEFQTLLVSDQVRAELDCTGEIYTAGVSGQGRVGWSGRPCYTGEILIELLVDGQWQVVASQGCFNLVRPMPPLPKPRPKLTPPPQPLAPPLEVTSKPPMSSPKVFIQQTPGVHVHTSQCCHGCGSSSVYLPGNRAILLHNR